MHVCFVMHVECQVVLVNLCAFFFLFFFALNVRCGVCVGCFSIVWCVGIWLHCTI